MRRRLGALTAFILSAGVLLAQEEGKVEKGASGLSLTLETILLWVNFAVLVIGLGYLIKKFVAPFFAERSGRIAREITEASRIRQEADARTAEVEKRLASLEPDLKALRAEAEQELTTLEKRIGASSSAAIAQIRASAQQEITGAAKTAPAEARPADMESSMASLSTDLTALRAESHQELESLERQIGAKTTAEIARIESNAKQEIEAAGKAARLELKRYSAELAVNLAGEKIRTKMTAGAQEMLVRDFVKELDGSVAHAQSN